MNQAEHSRCQLLSYFFPKPSAVHSRLCEFALSLIKCQDLRLGLILLHEVERDALLAAILQATAGKR